MAGTVRDNSLSGQIVANYRVGRMIGRGGMGAVYEAVHQFLGRRAALKVLHAQFSQTSELTARFVNEARAANAVQHPSVVSVFEIGQLDEGTRYILMEYLDGPPLSQRVRELATAEGAAAAAAGGAPRVVSSMRLVRQLASALRALHDKGVIHRDLKPDNILIVKDPETPGGERAKLLDFGIAKFVSEYGRIEESPFPGVPAYVKTALGALLGTPMYMAPELWRAKGNVDHRADIYSLGCILFELLTGRPPYCASAIAQLMHMHVWQNPPPALLSRPDIPGPLSALVHKMLAKEPGERPTTTEVESVLDRLLAGTADVQPTNDASTIVIRSGEVPKVPAPAPPSSSSPPPDDQTMPLQRVKQIVQQVTMIPTLDPQMVMFSGGNSLHGGLPPTQGLPPAVESPLSPPGVALAAGRSPLGERSPSGSAQLVPLPRMTGRLGSFASAGALGLGVFCVWLFTGGREKYRPPETPGLYMTHAPGTERLVQLISVPLQAELRDAATGKVLGSTPYTYTQTPFKALGIIVHKPGYKDRSLTLDWFSTASIFTVKMQKKRK